MSRVAGADRSGAAVGNPAVSGSVAAAGGEPERAAPDYIEGGDAHAASKNLLLRHLHSSTGIQVTRRGCAARRGLAENCATVSEREGIGGDVPRAARGADSGSSRSETCRSARKALRFYRAAYRGWRERMGAGPSVLETLERPRSCARARYLAERWRFKARAARRVFEAWHWREYAWREWLPAKWQRIIQCETYSTFSWNSGTYQGAFGFHRSSWDAFRLPGYPSEAYLATPRQQYEVALAIWRRYGFSGWGCRGA